MDELLSPIYTIGIEDNAGVGGANILDQRASGAPDQEGEGEHVAQALLLVSAGWLGGHDGDLHEYIVHFYKKQVHTISPIVPIEKRKCQACSAR